MPKPRKAQVSLEITPYYHCVSRCVRRAFLCGVDSHTGKSYEHRRQWIVDRMKQLAEIFAIDICAYAVLSNHYHVILHVDIKEAAEWSEEDIIERWERLFSLPLIIQRYRSMEVISKAERDMVSELVTKWRKRLHDISWFMRCINEPIARQANQEDGCTGRYWEGRYKSQALLDEKALAACMAYVDLNPVRAGMAKTPEQSEYTSIAERTTKLERCRNRTNKANNPAGLLPFAGDPRKNLPKGLPFRLNDYLELVDWTGRAILETKRGHVPGNQPPILDRLAIDPQHWLYMTQHFESRFKGIVGASYKLKDACRRLGYQRTPNLSAAIHYLS
ncbi:MAG: transposase [Candidatus Thiodiazotropha sp. (ex Lucina aurantia)]|uniref:Transposase n=1 Tax=Candidatus Thiodiazotropha taylori TaxID=2792791 RepID=A0A9E4NK09_9GAMM|nr:transposase [Candidatus Thiodiazotropha taylori]MBV2099729.1 transposase [Candidatus Thiodiazotropha sp. (ex Codakia orbicularis)]MBV2101455.1 transposase [Candidatus Thiodiazotropha sp. (ex Lucina aurantia)]MCW4236299.1 transposase [Candidatus Thiodiazotropha endolucinida]MBV2115860.1 transposase [Candidatus Thiodiazotropha sp. (ex Lucina aurantia)]